MSFLISLETDKIKMGGDISEIFEEIFHLNRYLEKNWQEIRGELEIRTEQRREGFFPNTESRWTKIDLIISSNNKIAVH